MLLCTQFVMSSDQYARNINTVYEMYYLTAMFPLILHACLPTVRWNLVLIMFFVCQISAMISIIDGWLKYGRPLLLIGVVLSIFLLFSRHYERLQLYVGTKNQEQAEVARDIASQQVRDSEADGIQLRSLLGNTAHDLKTVRTPSTSPLLSSPRHNPNCCFL